MMQIMSCLAGKLETTRRGEYLGRVLVYLRWVRSYILTGNAFYHCYISVKRLNFANGLKIQESVNLTKKQKTLLLN